MKTIRELFGLGELVPYAKGCGLSESVRKALPVIESQHIIGIEVEVENFREGQQSLRKIWSSKGDGSLRNNGMEFVTHPIPASDAPSALFHLLAQVLPDSCCFSPRTSTHVHFNMTDWDVSKVKELVLWYTVFENLLFRFAGRKRNQNIYCVPLTATNQLYQFYQTSLERSVSKWSKYSSLNLLTLHNLGTVEFRHMHGTFDVAKLCTWIRLICRLCEYVQKSSNAIETLSRLSDQTDYVQLLGTVFGEDEQYLRFSDYRDIQQSVDMVKYALVSPSTTSQLAREISDQSPLLQFKRSGKFAF